MKSLLISHIYFPPQVGGISRFLECLTAAMGPERICCLTGVPAAPNGLPASGSPVVYRSPRIFSGSSKVTRALSWTRTMGSIMLRERPRTVLLGTVYDGPYGTWLHRWLNLPYVALAYGNEILGILNRDRGLEGHGGAWLRGASRVIAVSEFTAGLVQRAGVEPHRIVVAYPGCDSAHFSPRPPNAGLRRRLLGDRAPGPVLLTTGNLVPRKGHDMVIRSLMAVRARVPDVTYLVVGDGPHRAELAALAVAQGVREQVVFAGQATDEELPDLYALADLFVMASRERENESDVEGFGIVFLEAAACGKPVVGGRSGGIPEALVHGETGWLVDPSDPAQIAEAIVRVLADRESASRMGERGRARVVRSFTWDETARRVQEVMGTTVEARKGHYAKG